MDLDAFNKATTQLTRDYFPDARARRVDVLADGVEVAAVRLVVAELDHEVSFVALACFAPRPPLVGGECLYVSIGSLGRKSANLGTVLSTSLVYPSTVSYPSSPASPAESV